MKDELDRLRGEVLALFPRLEAKLGGDLPPRRRELLSRGRAALAAGRYLVLTIGEFKRGKSSLLNALIEERLFPVDPGVATATICTLSWGESPRALLHLLPAGENQAPPPPKAIELSEVPRYATEQGRAKGDTPVARIDMVAPIPQLKSGLTLVDTPGFGSMNPAHTAATSGFLPEADALLFVASAMEPLGTVELSFLARAYEKCPLVLTAVTMIDKTPEADVMVAQTRDRIADVTALAPDEVDLVGVSAPRKWTGLKNKDQALIQESGFPELEDRLWSGLVTSCAISRLSQALDALEEVATASQAPLLNEKAGLAGQEALKDIDAQLKAAQARAHEAKAAAPRRSRELAAELEERFRPIRRELARAFDDLHADFQKATRDRAILTEPTTVINGLVQRMVDAQAKANRDLNEVIEEVAAKFSENLSIPLTGTGGDVVTAPVSISAPRIDVAPRRFASFRTVWGGATAAGAAGLVAGSLLALAFPPAAAAIVPAIGALLGEAAGLTGGLRLAKTQRQEREDTERRSRLREHVLPKIDSTRAASLEDLNQRLRDQIRALTLAMDGELELAARSLETSRAQLQEARTRTAAENTARLREVERRLQDYDEVFRTLAEMRYRIEALAQAGDAP